MKNDFTVRPETPVLSVSESESESEVEVEAGVNFSPDNILPDTKHHPGARLVKRSVPSMAGGLLAALILAVTGYVSIDAWISSNIVRNDAIGNVALAYGDESGGIGTNEGSDEAIVSKSAIDSYVVSADMPRVLNIPSINVRARVLPMGVTSTSAIQAPVNIFDSGWYTGSSKPGQPGVSFIDAHASGATREGLFAYLDTLKLGSRVSVEMGDGSLVSYAVNRVEVKNLSDVKMSEILKSSGSNKGELVLMTCSGKWVENAATYDKRVVVYASII